MPGADAGERRAGSSALSLFANPLNAGVLRAHAEGPRRLADVVAAVGSPAESTVRAAIANLRGKGALERMRGEDSARTVATRITPAGRELLFVADEVEAWLARSPAGPIEPGSDEAKSAVKALAGGWSSTLIRELAGRPVTLAELDESIPDVSHPMLERRIAWMRSTGQIEAVEREGRGTPYVVTDWLRRAVAPLSASGRCERRHMGAETAPITEVEIEAAFLMAVPLAKLPPYWSGTCLLAARPEAEEEEPPMAQVAGVTVEVEVGRVAEHGPTLASRPSTWALGSSGAWLDAVIDGEIEGLRVGGERPQLALDLVVGMHTALFVDR